MVRSKEIALKNAQIQREQVQLLQIEQKLEDILAKVNESINVLKVEELQLKSSAISAMNIVASTSSAAPMLEKSAVEMTQIKDPRREFQMEVNKQEIDLNLALDSILTQSDNIEEDDE